MTTPQKFDYATTGLAEKNEWKIAVEICHQWLNQNMAMFGPDRIASFMHNQPIAAAKQIQNNCDDPSVESMTVALLGPAKFDMIAQQNDTESLAREQRARHVFGDRTIDLIRHMAGEPTTDAKLQRDANRMFLVEGLSTMDDQLIDRKRIDKHHQVRWNILENLETHFANVKGENPKIDVIFEDALKKSRTTLEGLDKAAENKAANKPAQPNVKRPKPPKR